jgi:hypothetical protein
MRRQLGLWPSEGPTAAGRQIWEGLDKAERNRVIAALVRLIIQAVRRERTEPGGEDKHEH